MSWYTWRETQVDSVFETLENGEIVSRKDLNQCMSLKCVGDTL